MVIVYSSRNPDRLLYILDEIFTWRLGVSWEITNDPGKYLASESPVKINYSKMALPGIQLPDSGFLETTGISPEYKPPVGRIDYHWVLFPQEDGIGFDVFAMAFWCLSRYEEYQPFEPDMHGRFCSSQSLQGQNGVAEAPVLDIALNYFYQICGLQPVNKFAVYPTLDIDIAYKFKGRPLTRQVAAFFRDLFNFRFQELAERIKCFFGKKDPWDVFEEMSLKLASVSTRTRFFIHVGPRSEFDKSVPITHKKFGKEIIKLSQYFSLGVHPGYVGGESLQGIISEKTKLQNFINIPVIRSRQHFLRLRLPETYLNLLAAGIKHDYTMGFPDQLGFRAGTGHSFRFYNLLEEKSTDLVIHPFCTMDVTLKNYMNLSAKEACEKVELLKNICRKFGVPFSFIYHNESYSGYMEWKGWKTVFEKCLE